MRNLALSRSFVTYDMSSLQTVEMIRLLKKQLMRQNAVGNMLVRKFSFAPIEAKIQLFKSYCYPIYRCGLWRHSYQNSIRKLTVSFSDTFKRLINVPSVALTKVWVCSAFFYIFLFIYWSMISFVLRK